MNLETVKGSDVVAVKGSPLPPIQCLIKHGNNGWTGHFELNSEVELPDGRRVAFRRNVAVRATQQIGRKARAGAI